MDAQRQDHRRRLRAIIGNLVTRANLHRKTLRPGQTEDGAHDNATFVPRTGSGRRTVMASIDAGPAHRPAPKQTIELLLGNAVAFAGAADQARPADDGDGAGP